MTIMAVWTEPGLPDEDALAGCAKGKHGTVISVRERTSGGIHYRYRCACGEVAGQCQALLADDAADRIMARFEVPRG